MKNKKYFITILFITYLNVTYLHLELDIIKDNVGTRLWYPWFELEWILLVFVTILVDIIKDNV